MEVSADADHISNYPIMLQQPFILSQDGIGKTTALARRNLPLELSNFRMDCLTTRTVLSNAVCIILECLNASRMCLPISKRPHLFKYLWNGSRLAVLEAASSPYTTHPAQAELQKWK